MLAQEICRSGLPCLAANSAVRFDPPASLPAIVKLTVPSLSRAFHSVRLQVGG
jgi:hypothetical protein